MFHVYVCVYVVYVDVYMYVYFYVYVDCCILMSMLSVYPTVYG